jgi:hypothetical protein
MCGGNGQLVSERPLVTPERGVTSSSQTLPLVEEEAPLKTCKVLERKRMWSWIPMGHEIKIHYAVEDQQHFNQPHILVLAIKVLDVAKFITLLSLLISRNYVPISRLNICSCLLWH